MMITDRKIVILTCCQVVYFSVENEEERKKGERKGKGVMGREKEKREGNLGKKEGVKMI